MAKEKIKKESKEHQKEENGKAIISSHDRFFKVLFEKKEEVNEFITKTFPPELTDKLNLETLELDKTEYIDSELRTSFSDVVYNCRYGENLKVKISLLFEHKSQPERFPQLQLISYMIKIWLKEIEQAKASKLKNFKLPVVIPIIFYHGKSSWKYQDFEKSFSAADSNLINFIPKFDYQLIDLSDYTDTEIKELTGKLQLQIGLLLMKNIFDEQKLLNEFSNIFAKIKELLNNPSGKLFFESIVSYLYYATKIDTQKFVEKMETMTTQGTEIFISTAMKLEMRGEKRGIEKGIEKEKKRIALELLENNVLDEIILAVSCLTKKQLEYLKTSNKH